MARKLLWCLLLSLLPVVALRAQQVEFSNGDQLSGKWVSVEGTTFKFNSLPLGKVAIPAGKVASFTIAEPLVVVLHGGKAYSADRVQLASGTWTVDFQGRSREFPAGQIATIVPAATYRSAVTAEASRPWRGWRGSASFGYSLQNGDQNARTLSIGMSAVRRHPNPSRLPHRPRPPSSLNLLVANPSTARQQVASTPLTTPHPPAQPLPLGVRENIQ